MKEKLYIIQNEQELKFIYQNYKLPFYSEKRYNRHLNHILNYTGKGRIYTIIIS